MADIIWINACQGGGKSIKIYINKNKTAKDLSKEIRKSFNLREQIFHLVLESTIVQEDNESSLDSIGFRSGCTVHLVFHAAGGIHKITPLQGYVTLTSTESCCIMGEDDPNVERVKMQCGCVFDIGAVKDYCSTKVEEGSFYFPCANNCKFTWPSVAVSHVLSAAMTDSEFEYFSKKVNENFFKAAPSNNKCPTCENFLTRDPNKKYLNPNWVVCAVCQGKGFCWACQKPWLGDSKSCGNGGCDGKDPLLKHLKDCPTITIGTVSGVPSIRCCEKCGRLIQHTEKCKHMHCVICKYDFCFVCLKPKNKETGQWQCGAYDSPCSVAPRQSEIFDFQPIIEAKERQEDSLSDFYSGLSVALRRRIMEDVFQSNSTANCSTQTSPAHLPVLTRSSRENRRRRIVSTTDYSTQPSPAPSPVPTRSPRENRRNCVRPTCISTTDNSTKPSPAPVPVPMKSTSGNKKSCLIS